MSFTARLTRCPLPFDADRAAEARARFPDFSPELSDLVAGTAGCSPFLSDLIARETTWLADVLAGDPEPALATILQSLEGQGSDALSGLLRQAKRRVALLTAFADLGGVWTLETVTSALTALADASVNLGIRALVADEVRRGRLPDLSAAGHPAAGMVALAMGKMGAGELNYSSDIDLILLFDETAHDPADVGDARTIFVRIARRLTALIGDRTSEGYVFRTDLRLRPDAAVTPVCISMGAAEQYYEAQGRTWERAAFIKARACGGDLAAGERFLKTLTPFVWRKHLDFAAIQDAHDMRLRIRDHKGLGGALSLDGHDLKLGRGGIREIEFFTQTRQLIAGGRDTSLRLRGTIPGLAALAERGWVDRSTADTLTDDYRAHREVEHRLQMVNDAQTQTLPATPEAWSKIAHMMGIADAGLLQDELRQRLERVAVLTEAFFAPGERKTSLDIPPAVQETLSNWRSYPALRSERAVAIFKRLEPEILSRLQRAASPEEALRQFDGFLAGLPAGVQLFSLFEANPTLIDLIVDICSTAPGLANYLSRNARVLDAVLGGDFFTPWPGAASLTAALSARLAELPDYERQLNAARTWASEWHFRIGVHHLRGLIDAATAGREYADLAGAVVAAVWEPCREDFIRRNGSVPGRDAAVIAMGSLGAERLNAASDLDLLIVYDADADAHSDGPKALAARTYYARLTQSFVTALKAPMAEGRLYDVDMRLRPSGRQGPVAVSLSAFRSYQMDEAWTWEHLALTRARPIAGDPDLAAEIEMVRRSVLVAKSTGSSVASDTADMRRRIFAAKAADGPWEAKIGPGRLQDIELFAQSLALRAADPARRVEAQLRAGVKAGLIDKEDETRLQDAHRFLWRLQAVGRLLTDRPLDLTRIGEGACAFLLRETGTDSAAALADRLSSVTDATAATIGRYLAEGLDGHAERTA